MAEAPLSQLNVAQITVLVDDRVMSFNREALRTQLLLASSI
jgi:hypothetical protein